jgi:hypothetical protein
VASLGFNRSTDASRFIVASGRALATELHQTFFHQQSEFTIVHLVPSSLRDSELTPSSPDSTIQSNTSFSCTMVLINPWGASSEDFEHVGNIIYTIW